MMSSQWRMLKAKAKAAFRAAGLFVYRVPPRGTDLPYDLASALPRQSFSTVIDVGANLGQSAKEFLRWFPEAHIWCFEPGADHYSKLARCFESNSRITCECYALGSSETEAMLCRTSDSTMSHIAENASGRAGEGLIVSTETVCVTTLDYYCRRADIEQIDFLKIDLEGYDLEVLRGASGMLMQERISCVQCECSLNPDNRFHVSLGEISAHLQSHGYRMFGLYEQKS